MKSTLPKTLYVRMAEDNDGTWYPWCYTVIEDAIEGDGPSVIGVYELTTRKLLKKVVAPA